MIGAPLRPTIILLPVKTRGKTVALIYGDFEGKRPQPYRGDLLEILANEAALFWKTCFIANRAARRLNDRLDTDT